MAPAAWSPHPGGSWQQPPAVPVSPQPIGHPVSGRPVAGVPEYPQVTLAPGEAVKREWLISRMNRLGWIDSCLTVTDARVIYRARAKSFLGFSSNWREVQIQDVSGAALVTRRGLTPLNLLAITIGFILAMFAINIVNSVISLTTFSIRGGGGAVSGWAVLLYTLAILVTIGILIARYFSKQIALVIYARGIDPSPIGVSGSRWRQAPGMLAAIAVAAFSPLLLFAEWLGLADATAATDQADPAATQAMYNDFGALVLDLQNRRVLGGQAST